MTVPHPFQPAALRRARHRARLTQAELSRRVGTARPRVSEWETGTRTPGPRTLRQLAVQLSVTPGQLVDTSTLRGKRYATGLTRAAAARRFGTTAQKWGRWETGYADAYRRVAMEQALHRWASCAPSMKPQSLRQRTRLEIANPAEATEVIERHHYLGWERTMAQLPYWIYLDGSRVGVVLFSLPRIGKPLYRTEPMRLLELARVWITPTVQHRQVGDSAGVRHTLPVGIGAAHPPPHLASVGIGAALRTVRQDWYGKYPHLPIIVVAKPPSPGPTPPENVGFGIRAPPTKPSTSSTWAQHREKPPTCTDGRVKRSLTRHQLTNAYQTWAGRRSDLVEHALNKLPPPHIPEPAAP